MTYKWIKDYVMQLINRYSLAGGILPETYNDQQDYLNRIPSLVDDAVMYIATAVRRIPACVKLSELENLSLGDYVIYTLPQDCYQVKNDGILYNKAGNIERTGAVRFIGDTKIVLQNGLDGAILEYYRYPHLFNGEADDDTEIDNTPDTHTAAAYYAAAHLMLDDNEFGYAALYNEFEAKIRKLREMIQTEAGVIRNGYSPEI